jgi:hypothetical protein
MRSHAMLRLGLKLAFDLYTLQEMWPGVGDCVTYLSLFLNARMETENRAAKEIQLQ